MFKVRRTLAWLALAIAVALGTAGALVIARLVRALNAGAAQSARVETDNRRLRERIRTLSKELDELRRSPRTALEPAPAPSVPHGRRPAVPGADAAAVAELRANLAGANNSIQQLQTRIRELEQEGRNTVVENQRLAASEADLKERLAAAQQSLDNAQKDLKTREDESAELQAVNVRLREENRIAADKQNQTLKLVRSLEDLNRRRETYLNNILRRYREVTEQYRALAVRRENPGDPAAADSSELARIQNTISLVEDDLRQLTGLSSQAARLRQQIAAK